MRKLSESKIELLRVKENIWYAYSSGMGLRQVAKAYNTSPGSIRTLLIEEGFTLRKPGRPKKEN